MQHPFFTFERDQQMDDAAHFSNRHRKHRDRRHFNRIGRRRQREAADQKENPCDFLADLTGRGRDNFLPAHEIPLQ